MLNIKPKLSGRNNTKNINTINVKLCISLSKHAITFSYNTYKMQLYVK